MTTHGAEERAKLISHGIPRKPACPLLQRQERFDDLLCGVVVKEPTCSSTFVRFRELVAVHDQPKSRRNQSFLKLMAGDEQRDESDGDRIAKPLVDMAGQKVCDRLEKVAPCYELTVAGLKLRKDIRS